MSKKFDKTDEIIPAPGIIYGRNAVEEALNAEPVRVSRIFLRDGIAGEWVQKLKSEASFRKVPVQSVPGSRLKELAGNVNDQGVVALLADVGFHDLESWLADIDMRENPVVILLDHLEDPHNVGAIIRTAVATGCAGVIVPKHEMAALHGATVKASAGQIFKMPLIRIVNVNQTLVRLQEAGFWVAGLAMNAPQDIWNFRADMPLVVVAGNEAKGISLATAKYCDMMLSIPMKNGVESLNVSVSTSLVLYEIMRKRL